MIYTWDNNGNLLDDEENDYTYNHANRLVQVNESSVVSSYRYNGLGYRIQQTINGVTTTYSLDLAAGLIQVLSDGELTYLFGQGRVYQTDTVHTYYFLCDALGSVRQLVDDRGVSTLSRDYRHFGVQLNSQGPFANSYDFTGEWTNNYSVL